MMLYYFRNLIKRRRRDLRDAKVKVAQSQQLQYGTFKLFSEQIWLFALYFLWKLDLLSLLLCEEVWKRYIEKLSFFIRCRKFKLSLICQFAIKAERLSDCPNKCARFVLCWFWPIFLTLSQEELYILTAKYFIFRFRALLDTALRRAEIVAKRQNTSIEIFCFFNFWSNKTSKLIN